MHLKYSPLALGVLLFAAPVSVLAQALPANLFPPGYLPPGATPTPVPSLAVPGVPNAQPTRVPTTEEPENPQLEIRNNSNGKSTKPAGSVAGAAPGSTPNNCQDQGTYRPPLSPQELAGQTPVDSLPPAKLGQPLFERNEFQELVYISLNRDLLLYGYNLFQCVPSTFTAADQVPALNNYVVGPGDEILVRGWGQIDVDYSAAVDRTGNFFMPKVGNIYVAGLKYRDLQGYFKTVLGRTYRNFELSVNLGNLRAVPIFVVGQAVRPGNYTVSSLTTLVNAIFTAGGPTRKGSMRNIQLRRGGRTVATFDLYDLLLRGDTSRDVPLQPGDVLNFPTIGPLAAIGGSVNNPAIFELKATKVASAQPITIPQDSLDSLTARVQQAQPSRGRMTVRELLTLAGGLSTTATGQHVVLERIEGRAVRRVDEFDLDESTLNRVVQDGDIVQIAPISLKFDNAVTLRGNVARPARYPWRPGLRVSDLVPNPEDLIPKSYYANQNVLGLAEAPNQTLKPEATEINWDYAAVERFQKPDLTTKLLTFNLGLAVRQRDPVHNLPLQPGDIITVFSKGEVRVPQNKQRRYVRLEGEFNYPGVYQALPNETLQQLVARVGGITNNAYLFGASLIRDSVRQTQQRNLDEALARLENQVSVSATQGTRRNEDANAYRARVSTQQGLVTQLRTVKASGRLVLDLQATRNRLEDIPDIPVEDSDIFTLPYAVGVVNVFGQVYNQNAFIFQPGESVGFYLSKAGGVTKTADSDSMYILRADGSVLSRRQAGNSGGFLGIGSGNSFESVRLMPGDAIVVPEQLDRYDSVAELKDISQIVFQFAVAAGTAITLFQ
ncbi:SLBB domain-containing protein [Candidatus Cyanaurora vandensis]|uniref:polysaccharide biosynthesis/export family protein n=1 Tax=Candidatus Cyanaurora vandensis TaxID=2714958 RepID=UPI00257C2517|nr:SLBB domain-containing protein [Candidatus Cyanaurora vandensis]